jgi:2-dehydropantoate 2-reductase
VIEHRALNALVVGALDGKSDARLDRLVKLANDSGIETTLSPDIRREIWRKFLLLAPMASLSAMTRAPLGAIRAHAETWALAEMGMREVAAVAAAEGVALSENEMAETLAFVSGMPETWQASTLIDLQQGRRLEVEWLAGTVCRLGQAHGIDTPFHRVALGALMPHAAGS